MSTFIEYTQSGTGTNTLSGAVNGTNTLYSLAVTPTTLQLFQNGQQMVDQAFGTPAPDFAWTAGTNTATITWIAVNPPQSGDVIVAWVFTQ